MAGITKQEVLKLVDAAYSGTASGTNTYTSTTVSPASPLLAYVAFKHYFIKFTNANTGAVTINIDSLGAKNVFKLTTTPLVGNDILAGSIGILVYDGTNFQLLGGESLLSYISQRINSAASNFAQSII